MRQPGGNVLLQSPNHDPLQHAVKLPPSQEKRCFTIGQSNGPSFRRPAERKSPHTEYDDSFALPYRSITDIVVGFIKQFFNKTIPIFGFMGFESMVVIE